MAKSYIELYKLLWREVKTKFSEQSTDSFTLENLNEQLKKNQIKELNQIQLKNFREKFLSEIEREDFSREEMNLSNKLTNPLLQFVGVTTFNDLPGYAEVISKINDDEDDKDDRREIRFVGRNDELDALRMFWKSGVIRIFELYGVPMIGKTEIIQRFKRDVTTEDTLIVIDELSFNPNPSREEVEKEFSDKIFGGGKLNDFSKIEGKTLVIIKDFQELLKWQGEGDELHDIRDEFGFVKEFFNAAIESERVKVLVESRFRIHFFSFLPSSRRTVESLEVKGVKINHFWEYYKSKGYSEQDFQRLCDALSYHTGLLSLAYNDDFLTGNDLRELLYRPEAVMTKLWKMIKAIVAKLEDREKWILSALTFLKGQVSRRVLYSGLSELAVFTNIEQINDALRSLERKLLIQFRAGSQIGQSDYELNPLVREICYTFLSDIEKDKIRSIANLPFFKNHGQEPQYNRALQALEQDDFAGFYDFLKEARAEGEFEKVLGSLRAAQKHPRINQEGVWNEIGVTYRQQAKLHQGTEKEALLDKAIEALKEGWHLNPQNERIINELALYYLGKKDYQTAKEWAQKGAHLKNPHSYSTLINIYEEVGEIDKAYLTALEGVRITEGKDERLREQLSRLEDREVPPGKNEPLKVFLSYSHRDESIKERIDVYLANLKNEGKVQIWHDRKIPAGTEWDSTIKNELRTADIILLLISADSIASNYIWQVEVPMAMEREKQGLARVIPIFCKPCDFNNTPFGILQGYPKDAKPITTFSNREVAYTQIAKGIRKEVEEMIEKKTVMNGRVKQF